MTDLEPGHCAFKDLCLDANSAKNAAGFWAPALGLRAERKGDDCVLTDDVDEHTLWINTVPEPPTVKNRVHLDVITGAVADLVALGARVIDELPKWTVLADREGGEFCAFVRPPEELNSYRLLELVVDSADPGAIARWWADRFGVTPRQSDHGGFRWLEDVPRMPWEMVFHRVPEPKAVKNRVHWDVLGVTAEFLAVGATRYAGPVDPANAWDVLVDPEGNEFCVFAPSA
ncbi:MAG: VOC family protein [Actinomycetota bacterium]